MTNTDDLLENSRRDMAILQQLAEHGDDSAKPREVEFMFLTPEESKARSLGEFLAEVGCGEVSLHAAEPECGVMVRTTMPTTEHVVLAVSGFMASVAAMHGVEYDGWGCNVLPSDG